MAKYLTKKQKIFCKYYILLNDHYEAAINAGYKESTAKCMVSKWIKSPHIKKYLEELKRKDYSISNYLLEELTKKIINSDNVNTSTLVKAIELKSRAIDRKNLNISDSNKVSKKDLFQRIEEKADVFEKLEQSDPESDLPGNGP